MILAKGDSMFNLAISQIHNYKKQYLMFFISFLVINFTVDYLNLPYSQMLVQYNLFLVILNISINILMSVISALTLTLSIINLQLNKKDTKSSNLSFISVVFSIMTYGCTACVINFLAIFGISYSIALLPYAGLPYKILALLIVISSLLFSKYEMNKPCKVK